MSERSVNLIVRDRQTGAQMQIIIDLETGQVGVAQNKGLELLVISKCLINDISVKYKTPESPKLESEGLGPK
jgi:hypothetical protein